jgi:hypothetical protein
MFVAELFENPQKNLIVIYPGRFQPFHKGHKAVYDYLCKKYGRDHVYIATSNKTDNLKSPFSFSDKAQFMAATGVSLDRVIESTQPYQVPELKAKVDPTNTIMIYAVSQKDMAEDPRFASWTKKDGTPAHFQPLPKSLADALTVDQHSYIEVVPTFDFKIMGKPMTSASEIRAMYKESDDATQQAIIKDLFGTVTPELKHIMDTKLGALGEGKISKALGTAALAAGLGFGSPAQASDNPVADVLGAGMIGLRTAAAVKGMSKAGVQDELRQEFRNIARGDKNNSRLYQLSKKDQPIQQDPSSTDQDARDRMMRGEAKTNEHIVKVKGGYELKSKHGNKNLGKYPTKAGAEKRERQVQYFKHMGEDAAGVGVIAQNKKMAKDPRYSMSMTQDVKPGTDKQNRKALRLETREPYQQAIDRLEQRRIENLWSDIDEIKSRIATEKLSADHIKSLLARVEKMRNEIKSYYVSK